MYTIDILGNFIHNIKWKVVVIDKIQNINIQNNTILKSVASLNPDFRMILTDIPPQNNIDEWESLLDFILPENYYKNMNEETKEKNFSLNVNAENEISKILNPFILKQEKSTILEHIVRNKELIVPDQLTPNQRIIYQHIYTRNFDALVLLDKNTNEIAHKAANNVLQCLSLC